jgi:hypothetical protein
MGRLETKSIGYYSSISFHINLVCLVCSGKEKNNVEKIWETCNNFWKIYKASKEFSSIFSFECTINSKMILLIKESGRIIENRGNQSHSRMWQIVTEELERRYIHSFYCNNNIYPLFFPDFPNTQRYKRY